MAGIGKLVLGVLVSAMLAVGFGVYVVTQAPLLWKVPYLCALAPSIAHGFWHTHRQLNGSASATMNPLVGALVSGGATVGVRLLRLLGVVFWAFMAVAMAWITAAGLARLIHGVRYADATP